MTYSAGIGLLVGAFVWAPLDVVDALSSERAARKPAHVQRGPIFGVAPQPGGWSASVALSF